MLLAAIALLAYVPTVNKEPGAIEKTAVSTLIKGRSINKLRVK